jgi:hypothetical protein
LCCYVVKELGTFELHPGLYYLNSIEWAASAMEMSALAGWNVANLAASSASKRSGGQRPQSTARSETQTGRTDL